MACVSAEQKTPCLKQAPHFHCASKRSLKSLWVSYADGVKRMDKGCVFTGSTGGWDVLSVKERCNCRSCWKQEELSLAGAVGGIGPDGFPGVPSVSLVCVIWEKKQTVPTCLSVPGMPSELSWLCLEVASALGKEGIHTVALWMRLIRPNSSQEWNLWISQKSGFSLWCAKIVVFLGLLRYHPENLFSEVT